MINFIKKQFKKILIALGILGVAYAAPIIIDQPLDISEAKVIEKYEQSELKEHYKLQGAKFIKEAPNENEIRIEVGGVSEFEPVLRLSRWDNEVHFKIKPRLQGIAKRNRKLDLEGNKIKLDVGKKEYHFYEIENGCEFDITLKEKPISNIQTLEIQSKGLKFYYQPPLTEEITEEQKAKGWTATETDIKDEKGNVVCHRSENVVGSYAVYHESKQGDYSKMGLKNYRAGKAFHIYRPKIIDSIGTEVWGKLNITDNLLTVEIPQEFLDNAVYSVRHAAGLTFGDESAGATEYGIAYNFFGTGICYRRGTVFQPAQSGTTDNIKAWIGSSQDWIDCDVTAAINEKDSDGANSHGEIDKDENLNCDDVYHWETFTLNSISITASTDYVLNLTGDGNSFNGGLASAFFNVKGDENGVTSYYEQLAGNYTVADPWNVSAEGTSKIYSIYCTYTAGGADRRIIITD